MKRNTKRLLPTIFVFTIIAAAYSCRMLAMFDFGGVLVNYTRAALYLLLFALWGFSLDRRIIQKPPLHCMRLTAALMLVWLVLRTLKYEFVTDPTAARYIWYLYYLPMLFIPLLGVYIALSLGKAEEFRLGGKIVALAIIPAALFLLVITNDLHQQVFVFSGGVPSSHSYSHGIVYFCCLGWMVACMAFSLILLLKKSRIPSSGKKKLTPFVIGCITVVYGLLYLSGLPAVRWWLGDMNVVLCLLYAAIYESCMPRWLQKLKDAGRVEFYFFARLRDGTGNYEAAYLDDFYVDRTGTHTVQFYWLCLPKSDSDCANFNSESTLLNYDIVQGKTLSLTLSAHTIYMGEKVSSRYIWNVKFQQDGGEFTEATNASHKISLTSESFAVCHPNRNAPIPSEWSYNSSDDAYYMYFWVRARHGYEFAPQVTNSSGTVLLNNVQYTEVSKKELSSDSKTLYITLIAKRKLTEVRGTLKNFRFGVDSWFTEIVSNEPKKYTFPSTVVYDTSYSGYGVEAGQLDDGVLYYIYFDVDIGKGYYLPANAPVKVIQPEGYRANGMFDSAQTYSSVYKGDWYSDTPISQKYRTESRLEANCEGKEYWPYIEIKQPVPGDCPAGSADYSKPTSLPANMKVLSMQWLKDEKPMGTTDKFELGKSYILDLRIGFEGGKEMGHIYPINERDFKVNGKSMNAWLDHMDFTDGHVWHLYDSYKVVDPSTLGSITGKINSFNPASDMVTIQLFKSGYTSATYTASVSGNPASYTLPGIPFGTYTMKVSKKNHATREYKITLGAQAAIQNVQLRLKADLDANGAVNLADVRQFIAEISSGTAADGYEKAVRDYNSDGKADLSDVRAIILAIAGGN